MSKIAATLKFLNSHLLQNSKSSWAETWWEASGWNGDLKLLNRSFPISKMVANGGSLETLQTTSDSELLKDIWSDSQDGHYGTM